jgi:hypothetical protein
VINYTLRNGSNGNLDVVLLLSNADGTPLGGKTIDVSYNTKDGNTANQLTTGADGTAVIALGKGEGVVPIFTKFYTDFESAGVARNIVVTPNENLDLNEIESYLFVGLLCLGTYEMYRYAARSMVRWI